jgi:glutamate-5-semialdehyde dehydrogenase
MTTAIHDAIPAGGESTGAATPPSGTVEVDVTEAVRDVARRAKVASRTLATANRMTKDAALGAIAGALVGAADRIVAANAEDLERGRANGMSDGLLDRLALTPERIAQICATSRACPTRSARSCAGRPCRTACACVRSACPWAWSA